MHFLVVNYHYIHEENKYPYPGIYPTSVEKLGKQIKILGKSFEFIKQKDILDALEGKSLPEKACLLTFDDGLSSQYENALPLFEKFKIPAIFFINALPYAEGRACLVHKIHYSRANLPPKVFLDKVLNFIGKLPNFPDFKNRYPYSNQEEKKLKYLLNEYLAPHKRRTIIEKIFQELVDDEKAWCEQHYISEKGLRDLANRGFLGIHSYSHNLLIKTDSKTLKEDFKKNLEVMKKIAGYSLRAISYPYGYGEILKAAKVAESIGLKIGFTTERTFNRTLQSPLLFARVDTNDAPGGKSPIKIKEKRTLYFTENLPKNKKYKK